MDKISKSRRSWNMSRIGGINTSPEVKVRSLLHALGFRFRLHRKDLPGRPDIVLPRYRTVIFVHGCFWHRHECCRFAYIPKTRRAFWLRKFSSNVERDKKNQLALRKMGWRVVVVWECQLRNLTALVKRLLRILPKAIEFRRQ